MSDNLRVAPIPRATLPGERRPLEPDPGPWFAESRRRRPWVRTLAVMLITSALWAAVGFFLITVAAVLRAV